MPINAREKGQRGEREFCKWLHKNFNLDKAPERNLDQTRNGGADILQVYPFVFEVKRVEDLDIEKAWIQCKNDTMKCGGEPVVAFRKNGGNWQFLISAKHIGLGLGFLHIHREDTFLNWAIPRLGGPGLYSGEDQ